jgi:ribosome-associated protein
MTEPAAPLSKTRRKAMMHSLQSLGERLVDLHPARLAELALPERLADALAEARRITRHEARRRQMQYIGRLMREVDPAPIESRLADWAQGPAREQRLHRAAERWRERLLAEAGAIDRWIESHPGSDRAGLQVLLARTKAERTAGQPPRAHRELYRLLRDTLAAANSARPEGDAARPPDDAAGGPDIEPGPPEDRR